MSSAKSKIKGESVSGDAAKKQGEEWAAKAGSKLDSAVRLFSLNTLAFCSTVRQELTTDTI